MKKPIVIVGAILALGGTWYAFRPEKLFTSEKVNETFPAAIAAASNAAAPVALGAGRFHGVAHDGQGVATLYRLPDGKNVVRLTEFKVSNGPALHLYLTSAPDASDDSTVKKAEILDLGPLRGNEGDQNYDIPSGTDLSKYKSATVWCARFNVNFATAPISTGAATMAPASTQPTALASGKFHSVAHAGQGAASIYQLDGGKRVVRLTEFKTSNGPNLHLYLVAANDATDDATVKNAGFIDLGPLKGNEGDQNYDVPAGADLAKYKAVTVWCARFNVNFTTAPLLAR